MNVDRTNAEVLGEGIVDWTAVLGEMVDVSLKEYRQQDHIKD